MEASCSRAVMAARWSGEVVSAWVRGGRRDGVDMVGDGGFSARDGERAMLGEIVDGERKMGDGIGDDDDDERAVLRFRLTSSLSLLAVAVIAGTATAGEQWMRGTDFC